MNSPDRPGRERVTPEPSLRTTCLFLDVDGTLLDIALSPTAVVVPPSLIDSLERAERELGGALALVSGRTIADLDSLFRPLRLKASGVHGAEFRFSNEGPVVPAAKPIPTRVWQDLMQDLRAFPGCLVENKDFSFAVHYRAIPERAAELRAALDGFLEAHLKLGLRVLPGHCVFELKRPDINKGVAIARFLGRSPFRGRKPLFIGDDITDRPGFTAVAARGGTAYSVGETHPDVSGTFNNPADVRNWLATLGRQEALTA